MTKDLVNWSNEQRCRKTVESLCKNGFAATYCTFSQQAVDYILDAASGCASVGFGGSLSIHDLKIEEMLRNTGKELLIHGKQGLGVEERLSIMRRQLTCDLFLTGTNAITLAGSLVNIDASGNRAGSMFFGPKKVIVVAGRNKLVEGTPEDAVKRVKIWAAPPNARRLSYNTPCATTGFCSDCSSPDRICRITTIIERKPRLTDVHVLVVNEDLGL